MVFQFCKREAGTFLEISQVFILQEKIYKFSGLQFSLLSFQVFTRPVNQLYNYTKIFQIKSKTVPSTPQQTISSNNSPLSSVCWAGKPLRWVSGVSGDSPVLHQWGSAGQLRCLGRQGHSGRRVPSHPVGLVSARSRTLFRFQWPPKAAVPAAVMHPAYQCTPHRPVAWRK